MALATGESRDKKWVERSPQGSRIGIIAGGGSLPVAVAEAARASGYSPFIIGLTGNASTGIERFPHAYAGIGQVGFILRTLRGEGRQRIVLVGSLRRPNLFRLKLDTGFFRHLPQLLRLFKGGDDAVLRRVARFFEGQGFEVAGVHEARPAPRSARRFFCGIAGCSYDGGHQARLPRGAGARFPRHRAGRRGCTAICACG